MELQHRPVMPCSALGDNVLTPECLRVSYSPRFAGLHGITGEGQLASLLLQRETLKRCKSLLLSPLLLSYLNVRDVVQVERAENVEDLVALVVLGEAGCIYHSFDLMDHLSKRAFKRCGG